MKFDQAKQTKAEADKITKFRKEMYPEWARVAWKKVSSTSDEISKFAIWNIALIRLFEDPASFLDDDILLARDPARARAVAEAADTARKAVLEKVAEAEKAVEPSLAELMRTR